MGTLLARLSALIADPPAPPVRRSPVDARLDALETTLRDVQSTLAKYTTAETERAAEHAIMCDRLDRLYKRMASRIARESAAPGESPLALRRRLRGS